MIISLATGLSLAAVVAMVVAVVVLARRCKANDNKYKQLCQQVAAKGKQSENVNRFLIQNLPDSAVFLYDRKLTLLVAGGPALGAFSGTSRLFEGLTIWNVLPRDRIVLLQHNMERVFGDRSGYADEVFSGRTYRIHFLPVRDISGQLTLGMLVATDVTDSNQVENSLREAVDDLERSNRDLEQFANVASHELKAPLRRISGFAELLAEDYEGLLSDEADDHINEITDGVKSLQEVIEALLTYSRVQGEATDMDWVDLNREAKAAVKNLSPLVKDRKAQITIKDLPTVTGDATLLRRLFENLITNGIKFNHKNAPTIHISAQRGLVDWEITVEDNGPGIPKEYQDKIFQMFQRLHHTIDGSGIGLSLCKKIVQIHRGKIQVESDGRTGTAFHIKLLARSPDEVTGSFRVPKS